MQMRHAWLVALVFAASCTKTNPDADCANGACADPSFPVCDVDGTLGGAPGTCVAVTCTAGAFSSCKDSETALVCDADGSSFDTTACTNGCDSTLGCRACAPNQTVCASGVAETCGASGTIASTETCALGCSSDATRCMTLVPSNGLGMYFDMTTDPQDLTLTGGGTLDLSDGTYTVGSASMTIPSFDVPAPSGGAPIRVFVGKHVVLGDLSVADSSIPGQSIGRAMAVLATENLEVSGRIAVATGAVDIVGCTGTSTTNGSGGHGGGAHASAGGSGGSVPALEGGGSGGAVSGTDDLVPLRGGCPGGGYNAGLRGNGGGALQLVSQSMVTITGTLVVDGKAVSSSSLAPNAGGGGGGGILIESPVVTLGSSAKLLARGGGGGVDDVAAPAPLDDASAPPGATCATASPYCGNGGNGAAPMFVATAGANTSSYVAGDMAFHAGGGGGGIGRIRINTADANYTTAVATILAGNVTAGTLATH